MKPTFKLKDLIQQGESAIAATSTLIGEGMVDLDCSEVESLSEEQLSQLFSGIPESWDFVELAEVFHTDTLSDTLAQQFSELLDRRHGRQPHPQPFSCEERGVLNLLLLVNHAMFDTQENVHKRIFVLKLATWKRHSNNRLVIP
jgi:hypothetical protein